jgi:hypothetical protein
MWKLQTDCRPGEGETSSPEEGESHQSRRALTALFGERPTSTQRLSYRALTALAIGLRDLDGLPDEDLRTSWYATIVRILRVPS